MVIVNLCGGLGNQMFQYAFGRFLSILLNQYLFLNKDIYDKGLSNRTFDLPIFHLSDCIIGTQKDIENSTKRNKKKVVLLNEQYFRYDQHLIRNLYGYSLSSPKDGDIILIVSGHWQSYKYLEPIENILKKELAVESKLPDKWMKLCKKIRSENSVMINVRRGDYLQKLDYHGVVSKEYLINAIQHCKIHLDSPTFYVFSDDMHWCRNELKNIKNLTFVDETFYDPKYQYYFNLMCNCKHFILSNSTFCWWSGWLSKSKSKLIIAPKKWFTTDTIETMDLIPKSWIRI